jgi:hypothetical protein
VSFDRGFENARQILYPLLCLLPGEMDGSQEQSGADEDRGAGAGQLISAPQHGGGEEEESDHRTDDRNVVQGQMNVSCVHEASPPERQNE